MDTGTNFGRKQHNKSEMRPTELLQESRDQAISRMTEMAAEFGANAVLNIHLSTASISEGAAEVLAYETAVCLENE
ncbi:MAG: YbjQ family protein [Planctomycetota bacterium]|jgi:uncharacterized protein YbjQ (UPF0145 family)|nr:YbjQ family protein [Planctomycetota bacterium]